MAKISSGREPIGAKKAQQSNAKPKKRISAADMTAVICAALCACCLVFWSVSPREDIIAVSLSYDAPTEEEKGFWDRFSEAIAAALGYAE